MPKKKVAQKEQMTEKEAWEFCAKAFKKVEKHPCGICDVIAFSDFSGDRIAKKMYEKIDRIKLKMKKVVILYII